MVPAPLDHVGGIAESAAHDSASAFGRIHPIVGKDRHLQVEQRCACSLSDEDPVTIVAWVDHDRHTRRQQLRTSGGDLKLTAVVEPKWKRREDRTDANSVLDIRMGHRRLALQAPGRRRNVAVRPSAREEIEKASLCDGARTGIDGRVFQAPVNPQSKNTSRSPRSALRPRLRGQGTPR